MPHATPDELRAAFAAAGYEEAANDLIARSREAVSILRSAAEEEEVPVGASKLGGLPDLPLGMPWPTHGGKPLAFLAQIALSEVPRAEGEPALPHGGLLLFFYDAAEQPWGFDPMDKGSAVVLYAPAGTRLARAAKPPQDDEDDEEDGSLPNTCSMRFEVVTTYPELDDDVLSGEHGEALLELFETTVKAGQGESKSPRHQLLGHPLVIQHPMELQCELVSNGIYCGGELSPEDERRAGELEPRAGDWTLLLQLDSDNALGWMWGDVGMLYFWIRREHLAAGDFSRAWCILQCF